MDEQRKVASFIENHEIASPPAYRLLDLVSEVGEIAKDATESTDYGHSPDSFDVESDELGDVLFSLLALADAVGVDASDALDEALTKYDDRSSEHGTASSGN